MTDDFFDPHNPKQNLHSCEAAEKDCFIEPPNITNMIYRLPELWTDPSCNQFSASRFVFFLCGCCAVCLTTAAIVTGKIDLVTGMVTTLAGIAAGVYFASTVKDWRWKKWRGGE